MTEQLSADQPKPPSITEKIHGSPAPAEKTPADFGVVKELLEKNLKWSQIIYEQNRKINHKLVWSAVAEWTRVIIIVVPIILGIIYLPSFVRKYSCVLNGTNCPKETQASLEEIFRLVPLSPEQREQIKTILK